MDKNFRVANTCNSCKWFNSLNGYSGKKKNGYCVQGAGEHIPDKPYGSDWEDFVDIWNGQTLEEFLGKHSKNIWYHGSGDYGKILELVTWWKDNGDNVHTCHQTNICDLHNVKSRVNSHAKKHVKNNNIDWLGKLKTGS